MDTKRTIRAGVTRRRRSAAAPTDVVAYDAGAAFWSVVMQSTLGRIWTFDKGH
jgi:hypothetical protein